MLLDFLHMDKFLIVLSVPSLSSLIISLQLILSLYRTNNLDDSVIFNIKVSDITILLKL